MMEKNANKITKTVEDFAHPGVSMDIGGADGQRYISADEPTYQNATVERPLAKADDDPVVFATGRAFEALGDAGLRLENAVGEFVDNAVEAHASQIYLKVKYTTSSSRSNAAKYIEELAVVDTGDGMDYDAIKKCLALGSSIRTQVYGKKGIGRYGMGLPAAAASLAWRVEVYSRTDSEADFLYVYLDFENRE